MPKLLAILMMTLLILGVAPMHNDGGSTDTNTDDNYSNYEGGSTDTDSGDSSNSVSVEVESKWKNLTRDEYMYFTNVELKTKVMDFYGGKSFAYEPYEYYKVAHSGYTVYYVHYKIDFSEKLEVVHYDRGSSWKSILRVSDVANSWCYGCQENAKYLAPTMALLVGMFAVIF